MFVVYIAFCFAWNRIAQNAMWIFCKCLCRSILFVRLCSPSNQFNLIRNWNWTDQNGTERMEKSKGNESKIQGCDAHFWLHNQFVSHSLVLIIYIVNMRNISYGPFNWRGVLFAFAKEREHFPCVSSTQPNDVREEKRIIPLICDRNIDSEHQDFWIRSHKKTTVIIL